MCIHFLFHDCALSTFKKKKKQDSDSWGKNDVWDTIAHLEHTAFNVATRWLSWAGNENMDFKPDYCCCLCDVMQRVLQVGATHEVSFLIRNFLWSSVETSGWKSDTKATVTPLECWKLFLVTGCRFRALLFLLRSLYAIIVLFRLSPLTGGQGREVSASFFSLTLSLFLSSSVWVYDSSGAGGHNQAGWVGEQRRGEHKTYSEMR